MIVIKDFMIASVLPKTTYAVKRCEKQININYMHENRIVIERKMELLKYTNS